jgi:hypothetical protein
MAITPPATFRSTAGPCAARPSAALMAPVAASAASTAAAVTAIRAAPGVRVMASSGRIAPAVRDRKLAAAACQGAGDMRWVEAQFGLGVSAERVVGGQLRSDLPGQVAVQALGLVQAGQFGACGLGELALFQPEQRALGVRWLLTDTYSPEAVASAPADNPARPVLAMRSPIG